ncbi:hypothetical protein H8S45_03100 [Agathobaculum sp. NSJ-28]|uniref:Uncharacterized protein n=2 Tax=Agathobaculum TaxID=2048137 RepID=A0A923LTN1_9FIRM|nr:MULTISPECIES: hypothetical protein [Butyricicoccaceae]MBC5724458.1 hypothetical protein [Agathobaculum faecis]MCU6788198.1 hypothetical protein [Agathobaculum ammoniilyticum]WOC75192.1 hypothetical protein RX717_14625 [Intestinibacillus sp. NTUH-41-i26]SCI62865.1 Uncharacterised protein [uncultured Butyricicoccus sp.]
MNQTRRPHAKQPNYRLLLCIGLLVCLVLDILFFVLFLSQCSRAGGLEDEVKKLTEANQALTSQNTMLQQQSDAALTTAVAALPDPTTAQTTNLPDLIPQLTDAVYVVRTTGEGYQYLKIAEGAVLDKLNAYRDDASGYTAAEGDAPTCSYWVLFSDRVIGLTDGGNGFVSTDRTATGSATTVPSGFYDFVVSLFA